jgi:hypothetical protein
LAERRDKGQPGVNAARLQVVRTAGYCVVCDHIVEREPDGSCPQGHPWEAVTGRIVLADDEPVPSLPRFNIGAFVLPPIWGPAHHQWVGAIFLPIWLFMDSIVGTANSGGVPTLIAAPTVVAITLAFQAYFAKRANGLAYRAVCDRMSVAEYVRRERWWTIACVPAAAALVAWAVWFDVVVRPTLPR